MSIVQAGCWHQVFTLSWCLQCVWQRKGTNTCQLLPPTPFHITKRPKALAGFGNYIVNNLCSNLLPPHPTLIVYLKIQQKHFTLSLSSATCQPTDLPIEWFNHFKRLWHSDYTASYCNIQTEAHRVSCFCSRANCCTFYNILDQAWRVLESKAHWL